RRETSAYTLSFMLDGVAEKGILAGATVAGTASLVVAVTTKSNTGPWLAFAGALIVAVLTAVFTQRRQAQQLAAEERRLKIQLEHERQLRDVSELREVLTEAVETVMQASDRFVDLRVAFAHADAKERSEALAE